MGTATLPLRTDAYYRQIAAEALERAGCWEPPVPIETLISSLGIPVRAVNLPHFFTGAIVSEDGLPVVVLNWAKPEVERRDALAHMLSHVLLMLKDPDDVYPRDTGDHRPADLVAKELIMPTEMVLHQAQLWFNDYRYLARLFGVSEDRMLDRMRELSLIKGPEGLIWGY